MNFFKLLLFTLAVLIGAPSQSQARLISTQSFQELVDASDLVVIASPAAKTADTGERAFFADIFRDTDKGRGIKIASIGVETKFQSFAVLKGPRTLAQFTLHHYREAAPPKIELNGPLLVSFDPSSRSVYLLFLVRESDGRFAPTGGQTDPGFRAVTKLAG